MARRDLVVQTKRIERGSVGNRKYSLQVVERSESYEVTGSVRRPNRNRRARKKEARANCTRQNRTDCRTSAAIIRRQQRIATSQAGSAAARSEEGISTSAADGSRVTGCYCCVDES